MKVFILEDDQTRVDLLMEWLKGHDLTVVDSCVAVDKFQPPYDLILLDHDLGGRQLEDHEDNGLAFVRLIKGQINPESYIICHSYNPDGARAMSQEIGRGVVVPFGSGGYKRLLIQISAGFEEKHHATDL